jgi:hypothetical protein
MTELLTSILNVFKDINTHKKEQISTNLDTNTEVAIKVNGMLNSEQNLSVPLLNQVNLNQVVRQSKGHQNVDRYLKERLDNVDLDQPYSEITEVELIAQKIANRAAINTKIGNILKEQGIEPDQKTKQMQNASA